MSGSVGAGAGNRPGYLTGKPRSGVHVTVGGRRSYPLHRSQAAVSRGGLAFAWEGWSGRGIA